MIEDGVQGPIPRPTALNDLPAGRPGTGPQDTGPHGTPAYPATAHNAPAHRTLARVALDPQGRPSDYGTARQGAPAEAYFRLLGTGITWIRHPRSRGAAAAQHLRTAVLRVAAWLAARTPAWT